jgi:serine/threonine-protein kinase PknK
MNGGSPQEESPGERSELGIDGLSAVSEIGTGGSSTVYRARQDALDREVAVKVVHAAWSMETRERFEHERELMGRLSGHTAIVPILETGITRRGEPYLLMPYYPRGSLFRMMRHRGPLPWSEATFLLETVALTVADCHREGIVHRDVKPGNVLLTRHLHPRLADFGIALPLGLATSPATVAYTPSYSPPEAFEPGSAEPTTDVYGLGATLWALLGGHAPHTELGATTDPAVILERALAGPPDRPRPETPPAMVSLIGRSMHPDPAERQPDADAFVAELRRAARRGHPMEAATPGTPHRSGARRGAAPPVDPDTRTVGDLPRRQSGADLARAGADRLLLAAIGTLITVGLALVAGGAWLALT